MIYLDSASTTPISEEVLDEMIPFLTTEFGNPNSVHNLGIKARKAVEEARERVAAIINAKPEQIIFTSGGSEANNLAIKMCIGKTGFHPRAVIHGKTEHTSSIEAIHSLPDEYYIFGEEPNRDLIESVYGSLVWYMYVNNETGKKNPIIDIGNYCQENKDCLFGTDCVQALGFEKIDVDEIKCDFLTMSSHKIHGPKGVGALYVRDLDTLNPLISGGVNQEFGLRGGTENVAGIVGFGKACEIADKNIEENRNRILYLRNLFLEKIDGIDYKVNCNDESKILSIQLPGIDSETFVVAMSSLDVAISSGAACRNRESKPNDVLLAFGLSEDEIRNTVRVSFMQSNTERDISAAADKFKLCCQII